MTRLPKSVRMVEVGPRDGLQNEKKVLDVDTRVELITRAVDAGLKRIETVSFVNPKRVPQMAGAEEVMAALPRRDDVNYIGLVLNERGLDRADQFVKLELDYLTIPILRVLHQENHEERHNGRAGIDNQLPDL